MDCKLKRAESQILILYFSFVIKMYCNRWPNCSYKITVPFNSVFFNRRAAARYRALASIIPGRWNLSF